MHSGIECVLGGEGDDSARIRCTFNNHILGPIVPTAASSWVSTGRSASDLFILVPREFSGIINLDPP